MMKIISTRKAPEAIGPYSQAVLVGEMLYASGQIPLDPDSGQLVEGGIEEQTHQVLRNMQEVLAAAGGTLRNVVKTTVFIKDMNEFGKVNEIYGSYFGDHKPARSTVEVARLPKDARIEIEMVAYIPSN